MKKQKFDPATLRGAKSAAELDLMQFLPLAKRFAHRFMNTFGYDDALQIAFVGLCHARDKWDPTRGPFESIVKWYLQGEFAAELDKKKRRAGIPARERKQGKFAIATGLRAARTLRPYEEVPVVVLSASQLCPSGHEGDLLNTVADESPNPEEALDSAQTVARVHAALDRLGPTGARALAMANTTGAEAASRAARALGRENLAHLRAELADLMPRVDPLVAELLDEALASTPPTERPRKRRRSARRAKPTTSRHVRAQPAMPMRGRVHPDTIRGRILTMLAEGTHAVEEIRNAAGAKTNGNTTSHMYCLWRDTGVGYVCDERGIWSANFPEGTTLQDYLLPPRRGTQSLKERAAPAPAPPSAGSGVSTAATPP